MNTIKNLEVILNKSNTKYIIENEIDINEFLSFYIKIDNYIKSEITNNNNIEYENKILTKIYDFTQEMEKNILLNINDKLDINKTINNNIIECKNTIDNYVNRFKNISNPVQKGNLGEKEVSEMLKYCYPNHQVNITSKNNYSMDILLKHENYCDILFEIKSHKLMVGKDNINKYIRDIEIKKKHSIFISLFSGINGIKDDFHLKIHKNKYVSIYLSNNNFNIDQIKQATELIYSLSEIMDSRNEEIIINCEKMIKLNKLILEFNNNINEIKELNKQMKNNIERLNINNIKLLLT